MSVGKGTVNNCSHTKQMSPTCNTVWAFDMSGCVAQNAASIFQHITQLSYNPCDQTSVNQAGLQLGTHQSSEVVYMWAHCCCSYCKPSTLSALVVGALHGQRVALLCSGALS